MKNIKKLLLGAVICITAFLTTISPLQAANATAGGSTTVTLGIGQALSTEGTVSYEDNGVIESITVTGARIGNFAGTVSGDRVFVFTDGTAGSGTITVQVTLKSNAQVGACAMVFYTGGLTNVDDEYIAGGAYASDTVCVVASGSGGSGGSGDSTDTPQSTPRPSTSVSVDYSRLKELIKEAEGLDGTLYTGETWEALLNAVNIGKGMLGIRNQAKVDSAADDIRAAIDALILMDYTRLKDAIDQSNDFITNQEAAYLWQNFITAFNNANYMMTTNDQDAVDAAADELLAALDALKEYLGLNDGILVLDGEEFCNVFLHSIWPIVALISLLLNAVLGLLLVQSKKKKFVDTTPLVDYDINDDN